MPAALLLLAAVASPAIHLWHEPEWFPGVEGSFNYWTGTQKPTGSWGVAGPGISAEWSQGGESGWNSIGAASQETKAECGREIVVPRAGKYRVWVRFVEHRKKKSPFTLSVGGKSHVFGEKATLPLDDEYLLYWGFSFAWDSFDAELAQGKTALKLAIDRKGEAWRQVDAVLVTSDLGFVPRGREKPRFAYAPTLPRAAPAGTGGRPAGWRRPRLAGAPFTLWTGVGADPKWWDKQKPETLRLADVIHAHAAGKDIRAAFLKQWPRPADAPLVSSPLLRPGFYLGDSPDLSPGTPLRKWLERTKTPFFIMTNYASGAYSAKTGPATYAALTGPLAGQFLGYIHGEAMGTLGVGFPAKASPSRAAQADALIKHLKSEQATRWSAIYKTKVDEAHWAKGIPCLSVDSTALCHLFYEAGSDVVGYEIDATIPNIPLRMAFLRGAARQYGKAWINYASGNFGDACNCFAQEPQVPRGAKAWFHSKYAVTDGVPAGWYRSFYHLNHSGGASAIYWEQNLANQYILPGPGSHRVQLSPFGRGTEDFMARAEKGPDPGEPVTPVAFLLSAAHGYEPTSYRCRMLHHFHESPGDRELRELFNVAYQPAAELEGEPVSPYRQGMPPGRHGNIFDVIVDRPSRIKAIHRYRVVYATADAALLPIKDELAKFVEQGGTLVLNAPSIKGLPQTLTGVRLTGKRRVSERWGRSLETVAYQAEGAEAKGAEPHFKTDKGVEETVLRHRVGKGTVYVTLVPRMMGLDERAHPALAELMADLVHDKLPVAVRSTKGRPVMHQSSRNAKGLVVTLLNPHGVDKTQSGIARVDRRAFADARLSAAGISQAFRCEGQARIPLKVRQEEGGQASVELRLGPGSLAIVQLAFRTPKPSR